MFLYKAKELNFRRILFSLREIAGGFIMPMIERFIVIGDSLSDKGQMRASCLAPLSGLIGRSPDGRFTNGFTWDDFAFYELLRGTNQPTEALIGDDAYGMATNESRTYVRTYCIGGLTAVNYIKPFSRDIRADLESLVLSNLAIQREKIISDDRSLSITPEQKSSTLVIEWSGANDLITVRHSPTYQAAEAVIEARINNLEELIKHGYKHFILFNLPDLSLTPRFQSEHEHDRRHAQDVITYFNQTLTQQITDLEIKLGESVFIRQYDVHHLFTDAYNNPNQYGIDPDKRTKPLTLSHDFRDTDNPNAAKGYMFWDDVHPTEIVHYYLGRKFLATFNQFFKFEAPIETLLQQFREVYGEQLILEQQDRFRFFNSCLRTNEFNYKQVTLDQVFARATSRDEKVLAAMRELHWIDNDNQCITSHSVIINALECIDQQLEQAQANEQSKIDNGI